MIELIKRKQTVVSFSLFVLLTLGSISSFGSLSCRNLLGVETLESREIKRALEIDVDALEVIASIIMYKIIEKKSYKSFQRIGSFGWWGELKDVDAKNYPFNRITTEDRRAVLEELKLEIEKSTYRDFGEVTEDSPFITKAWAALKKYFKSPSFGKSFASRFGKGTALNILERTGPDRLKSFLEDNFEAITINAVTMPKRSFSKRGILFLKRGLLPSVLLGFIGGTGLEILNPTVLFKDILPFVVPFAKDFAQQSVEWGFIQTAVINSGVASGMFLIPASEFMNRRRRNQGKMNDRVFRQFKYDWKIGKEVRKRLVLDLLEEL